GKNRSQREVAPIARKRYLAREPPNAVPTGKGSRGRYRSDSLCLRAPAAQKSRQQSGVGTIFGGSDADPLERQGIELSRFGADSLPHALDQPLDLILASQALVFRWRGSLRENFGPDTQHSQGRLIGADIGGGFLIEPGAQRFDAGTGRMLK